MLTDDKLMSERAMTVTPLDLRQSRFKTVMRGFDKTEVSTLLEAASQDYEHALRENERLRHELVKLEAALNQHRELEGSLKNTLMSAQKVADDMRENAQQEAARILRDAEGRAEMMLEKAQARLEDIQREIDGLRMKRRETETNVEAIISSLNNTLEFIHEQEQREEKVVALRPRVEIATRPA